MSPTHAGEMGVETGEQWRQTADGRVVGRPVANGRAVGRPVARGEAALTDVRRAAAFRRDGGLSDLRRLADRASDPRVRARAAAVLRAFARLARATGWDGDDQATDPLGSREY